MTYFINNDQLIAAAHSCSNFSTGGSAGRSSFAPKGISCEMCRNWDGSKCRKNAFDNEVAGLDLE